MTRGNLVDRAGGLHDVQIQISGVSVVTSPPDLRIRHSV